MKNKLKKIGVLALVLANFVIFAPQKVEGQKTIEIDISDPSNGNNRHWYQKRIGGVEFYGCINGGNECLDDIVISG